MQLLIIRLFFIIVVDALFGCYLAIVFASRRAHQLTKIPQPVFLRTVMFIVFALVLVGSLIVIFW